MLVRDEISLLWGMELKAFNLKKRNAATCLCLHSGWCQSYVNDSFLCRGSGSEAKLAVREDVMSSEK